MHLHAQRVLHALLGKRGEVAHHKMREEEIKAALVNILGPPEGPNPHPKWGLPSGWADYLTLLFAHLTGTPICYNQVLYCVSYAKGRSWKKEPKVYDAMMLFCEDWPLPLTPEGVRAARMARLGSRAGIPQLPLPPAAPAPAPSGSTTVTLRGSSSEEDNVAQSPPPPLSAPAAEPEPAPSVQHAPSTGVPQGDQEPAQVPGFAHLTLLELTRRPDNVKVDAVMWLLKVGRVDGRVDGRIPPVGADLSCMRACMRARRAWWQEGRANPRRRRRCRRRTPCSRPGWRAACCPS